MCEEYPGYTGVLFLYHHITQHVIVKWQGLEVDQRVRAETEQSLLSLIKTSAAGHHHKQKPPGESSFLFPGVNEGTIEDAEVKDEPIDYELELADNELKDVKIVISSVGGPVETPSLPLPDKKPTTSMIVFDSDDPFGFGDSPGIATENPTNDAKASEKALSVDVPKAEDWANEDPSIDDSDFQISSDETEDDEAASNNPKDNPKDEDWVNEDTSTDESDFRISSDETEDDEGASNNPEDYSHRCKVCGKLFASNSSLQKHTKIHKKQTRQCKKCNKKFATIKLLRAHRSVHSDDKPFECETCGKRFHKKSHLKTHQRTHEGVKPHLCDICGNRYTKISSLKTHMVVHSGLKRYQCEICEKRFTQSKSLALHMQTHTGERPYGCNACEKRFARKGALERHMRVHTGDRPFKCKLCGRGFTQSGNLKTHMKTHGKDKNSA